MHIAQTIFLLPVVMAGVVYLIILAVLKAQREARELKLKHETYAKLIATGALDRETVEGIIRGIEGQRLPEAAPRQAPAPPQGRALFVLGWLGMFLGGALMLGGILQDDERAFSKGAMLMVGFLGLASLPVAWREMTARFGRPQGERTRPGGA